MKERERRKEGGTEGRRDGGKEGRRGRGRIHFELASINLPT
jgi:hypothetical protein